MSALAQELRAEEAKRDAHWRPDARWRLIQETIGWAEQQATVRRNTPAACKAKERRLLRTGAIEA